MAKLVLKGSPEAIKEKLGLGGEIGGAAGAIAGNFIPIPGVGPLIGRIGGQFLGEGIESLFGRKKRRREEARQREYLKNSNTLEGDLGEPQFAEGGIMAGKVSNNSGRTSKLRFRNGGKLSEVRKRPGGSNVGKKKFADGSPRRGPYAGPSGGAPSGSYPIPDKAHARAALRLAGHAPNPSGIRAAVHRKYPSLADGGPIEDALKEAKGMAIRGYKRAVRAATPVLREVERTINNLSQVATSGLGYAGVNLNLPKEPSEGSRLLRQKEQQRKREHAANPQKNMLPVYADGGRLRYAKGGSVKKIRPGDDAFLIAGPKHERGGVDLPAFGAEVEGGETIDNVKLGGGGRTPFVFSDRVKVPGEGMTFADAHKKAIRKGVGDTFVDDLARTQESVKEEPMNTTVGAASLLQSPKRGYDLGGFLSNINMEDVAQFAGPVANILGGLGKVNKAVDAPHVSRASLAPLRQMKTRFNINPALAEQRRAFSTLANNPAATSNQLLAAHSQSLRNRSQLMTQKENVETELGNKKLAAISGATQALDMTDQRTDAYNAQNRQAARAANLNLVGTGLGQVGEVISQRKQDERLQRASESQLAAALAGADPDVLKFFLENQDELRKIARTFRID